MKLENMSKDELELLSYTDLADLILKNNKKPMNTPTIFRTICDLLGYNDNDYANKIGDFYTSMTTDKRFVLLENANWDLKDNHSIPLVVDDEDEDIDDEFEMEDEEELDEMPDEDNIDDEDIDDELEDNDEEIEDLAVIDEDEELDEDEE